MKRTHVHLDPGDVLGDWVVEAPLTHAEPQLYAAHKEEDKAVQALLKVRVWTREADAGHHREVSFLRSVEHEAIATLVDCGTDLPADAVWCALEPFDATPLSDHLRTGPLPWREACAAFAMVADALARVHASGRVHRDLQPAKIMLGADGAVRLVGFELCMTPSELARRPPPLGALAYLAPEVLADPLIHPSRADLYAFGCVLYESLTGQSAFPAAAMGAQEPDALLQWKTRTEALDPGETAPDWLRNLVRKCTEPDPDRRLPDVEALVGWLDAARSSWEVAPAPPAPPPLPPPSLTRVRPRLAPPRIQHAPANRKLELLYLAAAVMGFLTAIAFSAAAIIAGEMAWTFG